MIRQNARWTAATFILAAIASGTLLFQNCAPKGETYDELGSAGPLGTTPPTYPEFETPVLFQYLNDLTVIEGQTLHVTAQLVEPHSQEVRIQIRTSDATAIANTNYVVLDRILVFPAGTLEQSFDVVSKSLSGTQDNLNINLTATPLGNEAALAPQTSTIRIVDNGVSAPTGALLATGGFHTCAIKGSKLFCWGLGTAGQLSGSLDSSTTTSGPRAVSSVYSVLGTATAVAASTRTTCAISGVDGFVYCFGSNTNGELGRSVTANAPAFAPTRVTNLPAASMIVAGANHFCAILASNGMVMCWGRNHKGQLGSGGTTGGTTVREISADQLKAGAEFLAAGSNHTCAIKNHKLYCWGRNNRGQIGVDVITAVGTTGDSDAGYSTAQGTFTMDIDVQSVTAGADYTCAIKTVSAANQLYCWGDNTRSQLGLGTTAETAVDQPRLVSAAADPVRVYANGVTTCYTNSSNELRCWGDNTYGQAKSIAATTAVTAPTTANVQLAGVSSLSVGPGASTVSDTENRHICAFVGTEVGCWGRNNYWQLQGKGSTTMSAAPLYPLFP